MANEDSPEKENVFGFDITADDVEGSLKTKKRASPRQKAQALLEDTLEAIERGDEKTFQSLFAELHGKNFSKKKGPQERKM